VVEDRKVFIWWNITSEDDLIMAFEDVNGQFSCVTSKEISIKFGILEEV